MNENLNNIYQNHYMYNISTCITYMFFIRISFFMILRIYYTYFGKKIVLLFLYFKFKNRPCREKKLELSQSAVRKFSIWKTLPPIGVSLHRINFEIIQNLKFKYLLYQCKF